MNFDGEARRQFVVNADRIIAEARATGYHPAPADGVRRPGRVVKVVRRENVPGGVRVTLANGVTTIVARGHYLATATEVQLAAKRGELYRNGPDLLQAELDNIARRRRQAVEAARSRVLREGVRKWIDDLRRADGERNQHRTVRVRVAPAMLKPFADDRMYDDGIREVRVKLPRPRVKPPAWNPFR